MPANLFQNARETDKTRRWAAVIAGDAVAAAVDVLCFVEWGDERARLKHP